MSLADAALLAYEFKRIEEQGNPCDAEGGFQ